MALTEKLIGEIAMIALQEKLERNGLNLNPKEIKRQMHNEVKGTNITVREIAEFAKIIYKNAFDKTMAQLDEIINAPAKVEEDKTSS